MTCNKCHGYIQTIGCKCEVDELKAQLAEKDKFIEGMKCCDNCGYHVNGNCDRVYDAFRECTEQKPYNKYWKPKCGNAAALPAVGSMRLLGSCEMCGQPAHDKLCLTCCRKVKPAGPALKRLRRFGVRVTYRQRECMRMAREITGAIPTEADAADSIIKMSHLYVAVDGKTYVGHEWICSGGSSYSWSESYPPNVKVRV